MSGKPTLTLIARQNLPPGHDHIVEHLQSQVCHLLASRRSHPRRGMLTFGLRVLCLGEDLVDQEPRVRILFELRVVSISTPTQACTAYLVERRLRLLLRLSAALVKGTHGGVELGDGAAYTSQQIKQTKLLRACMGRCCAGEGRGTYADMLAARGTSSQTAFQVVSSLSRWRGAVVRVPGGRECEVPARGRRR